MAAEPGSRLSPEQMEIRTRAKAAVDALTRSMEPVPRTWAERMMGLRGEVVAAFEGPAVGDLRSFLVFEHLAAERRVHASLVLGNEGSGSMRLEDGDLWPSWSHGCAIEALLRRLLIGARESPKSPPPMREVAGHVACIPDEGERFLWEPFEDG